MTQAVQWMAGISLLIWGLSCFVRARDWNDWLERLVQRGRTAALPLGSILVLLGSFVLAFHQLWHGLPLVLSVLGALILLEGSIYLLFPGVLGKWLSWAAPWRRPMFRLCGLVFMALAILLLGMAYGQMGATGGMP